LAELRRAPRHAHHLAGLACTRQWQCSTLAPRPRKRTNGAWLCVLTAVYDAEANIREPSIDCVCLLLDQAPYFVAQCL
jgi:hypothetical protein